MEEAQSPLRLVCGSTKRCFLHPAEQYPAQPACPVSEVFVGFVRLWCRIPQSHEARVVAPKDLLRHGWQETSLEVIDPVIVLTELSAAGHTFAMMQTIQSQEKPYAGKRVHLVLGCGGARGIAHIGVAEVLLEQGFSIVSVAGCSMGAVVGAFLAAGQLPAYAQWMKALSVGKVFDLMDFTLDRSGFLKGEKLFNALEPILGRTKIEDLNIPFTAVATDLISASQVIYREGDLVRALRASIAIPGIFTPVAEEGRVLVDGGVLNPVPLDCVKAEEGDWVIAVNANGRSPHTQENNHDEDHSLSAQLLGRLQRIGHTNPDNTKEENTFSLRELLLTSFRLIQSQVAEMQCRFTPPDLLIEIPISTCSTFEFHRGEELIALGRERCLHALKNLEIKPHPHYL